MAYKFVLSRGAEKDIRALDKTIAKHILKKLVWFEQQTNPIRFAKHLREFMAGDLRFRIGDYRVIAVVHQKEKKIEIIKIGHRRNIYF